VYAATIFDFYWTTIMAKVPPETEWARQAKSALKEGDAFSALRFLESASLHAKLQPGYPYLYAQALVQTGQSGRARTVLLDLVNRGDASADVLGLVGRTFKETWLRTGSTKALTEAISAYEKAVKLVPNDPFPAINAASLCLLNGNAASAHQLAKRTIELCEKNQKSKTDDRWPDATLGEAYLCLGDLAEAREHYAKVIPSGLDVRERCSARRQARILLQCLGHDVHTLDDCFGVPIVIVFSGHMIDSPQTPPYDRRFPPVLEPAVASEIKRALMELRPAIGFSSASAGSDIVFLEQMMSLDQGFHVLLSGPQKDFVERSINYAGADWPARFSRAVASAKSVEEASSHHPADNSPAYSFAVRLLSGRALMHAKQLNLDLVALAVWDGRPGGGLGRTSSFIEYWSQHLFTGLGQTKPVLKTIPLDELRARSREPAAVVEEAPIDQDTEAEQALDQPIRQEVKAMLFADVAGFNDLPEQKLPVFNGLFLGAAAELLNRWMPKPAAVNAWGNGFYMVFDEVDQAGRFALELRRTLEPPPRGDADWTEYGLPAELGVRIVLHAGPVFSMLNPLTRQVGFTGRHMNLAAALEPITNKGEIFSTDHFAVLAASTATPNFFCEYIGQRSLPGDPVGVKVYRVVEAE
jgi:class 3 adenylate cyclase/tetratricopeptide (TPR) repeat protein